MRGFRFFLFPCEVAGLFLFCCFGVVFWVFSVFDGFFGVLSGLFGYWIATEWPRCCLRGFTRTQRGHMHVPITRYKRLWKPVNSLTRRMTMKHLMRDHEQAPLHNQRYSGLLRGCVSLSQLFSSLHPNCYLFEKFNIVWM